MLLHICVLGCFCISAAQISVSDDGDQDKENSANTMAGGFTMGATQTGSAKRTLKNIKTQFYCGTEVRLNSLIITHLSHLSYKPFYEPCILFYAWT